MTIVKTLYEYINFKKLPTEHRMTSVWDCFNNHGQYVIGQVRWYGSWRQYCFFPAPETLYSAGCLKDIQDFIVALTEEGRVVK